MPMKDTMSPSSPARQPTTPSVSRSHWRFKPGDYTMSARRRTSCSVSHDFEKRLRFGDKDEEC
jgi:hypothetical protein